ncbi:DUF4959 domain-containing protein [Mucilaginibacter conchicola]|uniref:DUF4959 domain-containing protein n=1 Tax=Mucilaginibacter conchicola TaxID=2303333 RepID=A0A372P219_9SPHI|nr:DUF4959 domain-containing protein [Mucilaginibacter conchicola]RFZ95807.1 DUF4959 domain-containing protein [Mucilaginibacter conchicola]
MKNQIKRRNSFSSVIITSLLLMLAASSCKKSESNISVVSDDKTKPGVVTDVKVINQNGSAKITYKLPNSQNLLYVLASYKINGSRVRETKASYYTDTILTDGYAREQEYEVTLYAVSRAEVKSDPVTVKVHPLTPNYQRVNSNIDITPDFGGANFFTLNPDKAAIAVHVIAYDETAKKYVDEKPTYISTDTVNVSVRGYDAVPRKFGVYTTDRFGNVSDTLFKTLTPYFETLLDKSKFREYIKPTDSPIGYGWVFKNFFDGNTGEPGWHTDPAPRMQGTFSLGVSAKLSRFILWERVNGGVYAYQNIKRMTLWGTDKDLPADVELPKNSAPGTVVGDWINMGNFTFPNPPSGLPPNQANAADAKFVQDGVNFKIPFEAPATKYIRFVCTETWGGLNYVNALEISLYGNPL